jgi:MFS family permease
MQAAPTDPEVSQSEPSGLGIQFWSLIVATFLAFLGIGTVLPGMALHVRHDLGGSDRTVGFVIGTFSVIALGSRFISGPLADRKGRKIAFLTGLVACGCAGLAYFLPLGIFGMYLGRGMQGFGEACLYTGAAAWAVESAGVERSGRALGFVSTGIWGGFSAGPVIGQWLGTFERAAALQVIAAIAAFAFLWRVPEHYVPHPWPGKRMWIPGHLIPSGLAVGFVNIHYPVMTGFLILHMARTGGPGPLAFSAWAVMVLVTRFFLGGLPDRLPASLTYYVGLASMAAGLAILAFIPGPTVSVAATILIGFGFAFPWSSVAATVLKRTDSHQRGSTVGVLSAFVDMFVGSGSFTAGMLADRFGYNAAFMLALAGIGGAAIVGFKVFQSPPVNTGSAPAGLRG